MLQKVISIDLGGTNIRVALAQTDGELLNTIRKPTEPEKGLEAVLDKIEHMIIEVADDKWDEVSGIGMIAPGPLNPWDGIVIYAPNLGWKEVPLKQIFEKRLNRPVRIGNDANLAALAEHQFGAGQGFKNLIYLTISTGIGSGIIIDNRLLLGANGFGGEVGQMVIDMDGPMHESGVKGSIEALASGPALARRAREQITLSKGQRMVELAGSLEAITAKHIGQAAWGGDELAISLLQETGKMLGVTIVSLMSLFNPEIIIIGGGVSQIGSLLFESIRETVKSNLSPFYWQHCPIVPVTLGDDVGLLGGVALLNNRM